MRRWLGYVRMMLLDWMLGVAVRTWPAGCVCICAAVLILWFHDLWVPSDQCTLPWIILCMLIATTHSKQPTLPGLFRVTPYVLARLRMAARQLVFPPPPLPSLSYISSNLGTSLPPHSCSSNPTVRLSMRVSPITSLRPPNAHQRATHQSLHLDPPSLPVFHATPVRTVC